MIDITKNIINDFINEKSCKKFLKTPYYGISDKQISSVFLNFLKYKNKKENFLFTKSTVERILKIDISNIKPQSLSFIADKYNKEFSFCFLEKENISFCYCVDLNSIKIIVFNGNKNSVKGIASGGLFKNENNFNALEKSIVGSAIVNFPLNDLMVIPTNALYYIPQIKTGKVPKDYMNDLSKAAKNDDYLNALTIDFNAKVETIYLAIKCFVFLKTAAVIDKTFISGNKKFHLKNKLGTIEKNNDITVINSFYDESINVLNPFSVTGHFRNQPKKTGIEVIYIDGFMKQGYKRPAKILSENLKTQPHEKTH